MNQAPERDAAELARRYAERRGLDPLHPESEIMAPAPDRRAEPVRAAVPAHEIAQGRAGFRARFEAHRQRVAETAARDAQARDLVGGWDRVSQDYSRALPALEADPLRFGVARADMQRFGEALREQPELVRLLRERGAEFGLDARKDLARVLADAQPQRTLTSLMDKAETAMWGQLREAEKEAAREREAQARRRSLDRGPGLGR